MILSLGAALLLASRVMQAAELSNDTTVAFERYVRLTEARIKKDDIDGNAPFLWVDGIPDAARRRADGRLRHGEVVIERRSTRDGNVSIDVPGGLVHHWVALVFAPGVGVEDALALMQDYDRHAQVYAPNIVASRTLDRDGSRYRVYLRFFMKKIIGVTLNTEHEALFIPLGPARAHGEIRSTRIAEVENAGTARERERPPGQGSGFMWRLNTYWRFLQRDGGTYLQCETIALSRDIPVAFRWLIRPLVSQVPREALTFTLGRTRAELLRAAKRPANASP